MIIIEATIIISLVVGVYGLKVLSKKLGYKLDKRTAKKILFDGFELWDMDLVKMGIEVLKDFDKKNSTNKLDKYIQQIIKIFKDDENKSTLNEREVKASVNDFERLAHILDNDEEEEKEDNDVVEDKINEAKEVLDLVERRRKEMIIRRNELRHQTRMRPRKPNRRSVGGMG